MFGVICVEFQCHFDVILVPLGVIGPPWGPKTLLESILVFPESILAPLWGAFGSPWGTLRGAFSVPLAAPGAQEAKKTTHQRVSVRGPDF